MSRTETLAKIQDIFEEILDEVEISLVETSTAKDVEEWDSITHIEIISEIEDQFGVDFTLEEIEELKNIGDMITLVLSKN